MAAAEANYRAASALFETLQDTPVVAHLLAAIGPDIAEPRGSIGRRWTASMEQSADFPTIRVVQAEFGQALDLIEMAG